MSDIIDMANDTAHAGTDMAITQIRATAAQIPVGKVGECKMCGEWSGRLVNHTCAPCRDKHHLP